MHYAEWDDCCEDYHRTISFIYFSDRQVSISTSRARVEKAHQRMIFAQVGSFLAIKTAAAVLLHLNIIGENNEVSSISVFL